MKVSKNNSCEFSHGITKKEFIALPEMKKTRLWIVWAGIIEGLACALNMPLIIFVENLADNQTINPMMFIVILFAPMLCTLELFKTPQSTAKVFAIGAVELVMAVIALASGMCYALWLGFVSGSLAIIGAARINKRWKQYCSRSEAETAAEAEQAHAEAEQAPKQKQTALVQEIHSEKRNDGWIQYDILYPFGYGWDNMISAADNIIAADFSKIEKITYGYSPYESIDITADFENNGCKCKGLTALEDEEGSNIAVFGESRSLKLSVKIIWYNQTRFVRIITIPLWKEIVIKQYGETVIGKSFGIGEEVPDVKTENCGTAADDRNSTADSNHEQITDEAGIIKYLNELGVGVNSTADGGFDIFGKGHRYEINKEECGYALYSFKDRGIKEYEICSQNLKTLFIDIIIDLEKEKYYHDCCFKSYRSETNLFENNDVKQIEEIIKAKYSQFVSFENPEPNKIYVYNNGDKYVYGFSLNNKFYIMEAADSYKHILRIALNRIKKYEYLKNEIYGKLQAIMPIDEELSNRIVKSFVWSDDCKFDNPVMLEEICCTKAYSSDDDKALLVEYKVLLCEDAFYQSLKDYSDHIKVIHLREDTDVGFRTFEGTYTFDKFSEIIKTPVISRSDGCTVYFDDGFSFFYSAYSSTIYCETHDENFDLDKYLKEKKNII